MMGTNSNPGDPQQHGASLGAALASLQDVSHVYDRTVVLRHVTAQLTQPSCVLLLGENGAGKSTLLRVLAGLLRPRFGAVLLAQGLDQAQIGYMGHAPMLYEELTAMENLRYFAALYMPLPSVAPEKAIASVGLDPAHTGAVKTYSQGMRQRLSLARVLLSRPRLLLLDEPFSNMDAASAASMLRLLRAERSRGCAVVLTTHQRELAAPLADRIWHLAQGELHEEAVA